MISVGQRAPRMQKKGLIKERRRSTTCGQRNKRSEMADHQAGRSAALMFSEDTSVEAAAAASLPN